MNPMTTMDIRDFGDALIETQDLDPIYSAITGARLPKPQLYRLLLAYWCFYHLGAASWISEWEGKQFWDWMRSAAENKTATPLDGRWLRVMIQ